MPRLCFVIMPFSTTESCTEDEWTDIFNRIYKPAVEEAGLDYECRRSKATRGNIVGGIINDLNDSYVVLADLTDQNPNVFYELGVRHTLTNRSIILAQRREDIPFDLGPYAAHVYDWKSPEGEAQLTAKIRELLRDVDSNPHRPDNPVSDFLRITSGPIDDEDRRAPTPVAPEDVVAAQSLVGPGADGLDAVSLARRLSSGGQPNSARVVYRLTKPDLEKSLQAVIGELNEPVGNIQPRDVLATAQGFINEFEPITTRIEEFGLAAVEEGWQEGISLILRLAGDMVGISARPPQGPSSRLVMGVPQLLAWRSLIIIGAKALLEEELDLAGMVLREPLEVEELGGRFSHRSLPERSELFYPQAFLGNANHTAQYLSVLWSRSSHLEALSFHVGQDFAQVCVDFLFRFGTQ